MDVLFFSLHSSFHVVQRYVNKSQEFSSLWFYIVIWIFFFGSSCMRINAIIPKKSDWFLCVIEICHEYRLTVRGAILPYVVNNFDLACHRITLNWAWFYLLVFFWVIRGQLSKRAAAFFFFCKQHRSSYFGCQSVCSA